MTLLTRALSRTTPERRSCARPSFATLAVLWTISVVVLVLAVLQSTSFREAASGREALARVRAYWAARAGIEAQIARLASDTVSPDIGSALTLASDLRAAARAELPGASYSIAHFEDGLLVDGPLDAHSLLNVNTLALEDLIELDGMDETTAGSIVAWVTGESADESGAALDATSYLTLRYPYTPRGAPARSLLELELITGVAPDRLRGEDWNLNHRLDPGENDGDWSLPPDNADGVLDQGWSRYLTASSELGGYGLSGQPRINLQTASESDIASRLRVDTSQARAISQQAQIGDLSDFVRTPLRNLSSSQSGGGNTLGGQNVSNLSADQLRTLLDESIIGDPAILPRMGKLNINSVSRQTLERFPRISPELAESLVQARQGRSGGFVSLVDLLEVPGIDNSTLADLMDVLDVRSNVFIATCRGRDLATGIEVEIVAELDRSTIPVVIKDLQVR